MKREPLPPGFVGVADLIGARAVTYAQAMRNRARLTTHPKFPRPAIPGLAPFVDAASLWEAIERGQFPPPAAGRWGIGWPLEVIKRK